MRCLPGMSMRSKSPLRRSMARSFFLTRMVLKPQVFMFFSPMAIRASHSRRTGLFQRGSKKIAEPCPGSGPAREPGADGWRAMRAAPREPALRPRPCQGGLFSGVARRWPPAAAPVRALARGRRCRGGAAGRPGRLDASRGLEAAPHSAGGGLAAPVLEHSLRNAVLFGGTRTRYGCTDALTVHCSTE